MQPVGEDQRIIMETVQVHGGKRRPKRIHKTVNTGMLKGKGVSQIPGFGNSHARIQEKSRKGLGEQITSSMLGDNSTELLQPRVTQQ